MSIGIAPMYVSYQRRYNSIEEYNIIEDIKKRLNGVLGRSRVVGIQILIFGSDNAGSSAIQFDDVPIWKSHLVGDYPAMFDCWR